MLMICYLNLYIFVISNFEISKDYNINDDDNFVIKLILKRRIFQIL